MKRGAFALGAVALFIACIAAWIAVRYAILFVGVAFAGEQTAIFDQMVSQAEKSLDRQPPDLSGAAAALRYARDYYPSGSKQATGSQLDLIVERARANAQRQIIELLQDASGSDYGSTPDAWINAYEKKE